jgi:hypothetical protein
MAFHLAYETPAQVVVMQTLSEDLENLYVDGVSYRPDAPWPAEANLGGASLERIHFDEYGDDPINWGVTLVSGGTPGRANTVTPRPAGDLNGDLWADADDVDFLRTQAASGANDLAFDLNGDSLVDQADVDFLVETVFGTTTGDANLDGSVNLVDLARVAGRIGGSDDAGWANGDADGDQRITRRDLAALAKNFGKPAVAPAPAPVASSPAAVDRVLSATISRRSSRGDAPIRSALDSALAAIARRRGAARHALRGIWAAALDAAHGDE